MERRCTSSSPPGDRPRLPGLARPERIVPGPRHRLEEDDNDFSFNSGWGIALWRCARNVISRNAVDFCVRGYSHGVYNRGQDSAGIFVFEQNNENVFAENSATHGGDCFFGFAGREALGQTGRHPVMVQTARQH